MQRTLYTIMAANEDRFRYTILRWSLMQAAVASLIESLNLKLPKMTMSSKGRGHFRVFRSR